MATTVTTAKTAVAAKATPTEAVAAPAEATDRTATEAGIIVRHG